MEKLLKNHQEEDWRLEKELAENLMKIKGEARGVVLKTDMEFILKEKGEEGLKKVEQELGKAGHPINYRMIKTMNFYPVGMRILSLLAAKKVLDLKNEEVQKMGLFATKKSLIIRIFMKYFAATERVLFKEAPKIWGKYYTVGKLVPVEFSERKKQAILRIEESSLHPIFCMYCTGFFCGIGQMLIKSKKITSQETKCFFRGDKDHEFLIKWE